MRKLKNMTQKQKITFAIAVTLGVLTLPTHKRIQHYKH